MILGILLSDYPEKIIKKRFLKRKNLTDDEIYQRYFKDVNIDKKVVLELWEEVANSFKVPKGKLRPNDRFSVELSPGNWYPLDDIYLDFEYCINERLKKYGVNDKSINLDKQIKNVADYIEFFGNLEMEYIRKGGKDKNKIIINNNIEEGMVDKIFYISLFLFLFSIGENKPLLIINEKFEIYYRYFPIIFWLIFNLYMIRYYKRYYRGEIQRKEYKIIFIICFVLFNCYIVLYLILYYLSYYISDSCFVKIVDMIYNI